MPADGARPLESGQIDAPALIEEPRPGRARGRTFAIDAYLLAGIVVAGVLLRFTTLSTQSLWGDEGFTARIASSSLSSAASQVPRTESTPPLYYRLAWVWVHIFGSSAYALRSLSAILGCLTVLAVYWAAMAIAPSAWR